MKIIKREEMNIVRNIMKIIKREEMNIVRKDIEPTQYLD